MAEFYNPLVDFPFHMFAPLERQADRGLATVGDSFREAAQQLIRLGEGGEHDYLPINFLLRHAAELYLKSATVILHGSLKLPYVDAAWDGEPTILHSGRPTKLRNLHSIKSLSDHMIQTFDENLQRFAGKGPIDWKDAIPAEYQFWIDTIENYDSSGTFFRYPATKHSGTDGEKSQFKTGDLESALKKSDDGGSPVMALAFIDGDNVVQEAFIRDKNVLPEVRASLLQLVELMYSFTAALRTDIADGW